MCQDSIKNYSIAKSHVNTSTTKPGSIPIPTTLLPSSGQLENFVFVPFSGKAEDIQGLYDATKVSGTLEAVNIKGKGSGKPD